MPIKLIRCRQHNKALPGAIAAGLLAGALMFSPTPYAAESGTAAPDFTAPALQGPAITLTELRGKPVLLAYWATWCAPCRRELATLQRLSAEGKADFAIVAMNLAETRKTAEEFALRQGLSIPIALDLDGDIAARYRVLALPASFLIDSEGNIAERFLGELSESALRDALAALHSGGRPVPGGNPAGASR